MLFGKKLFRKLRGDDLKRLAIFGVCLVLVLSLCVLYRRTKQFEKLSKDDVKVEVVDAASFLPEEARVFKILGNGSSPGGKYYSINVYYPDDSNFWKSENTKLIGKYLGGWVVDLATDKTWRIAISPSDFHFYRWVSDEQIELRNDNQLATSLVEVKTGKVLSRRAIALGLEFKDSQAEVVEFIPTNKITNECFGEKRLVQGWVAYPVSCFETGQVVLNVEGYPKMEIKMLAPNKVQVGDRLVEDLVNVKESRFGGIVLSSDK